MALVRTASKKEEGSAFSHHLLSVSLLCPSMPEPINQHLAKMDYHLQSGLSILSRVQEVSELGDNSLPPHTGREDAFRLPEDTLVTSRDTGD